MITSDFKIVRFAAVAAGVFFLSVLTAVCYVGSIRNGFVSDDHYVVELNHDELGVKPVINMFLESDTLFYSLGDIPYYRPLNRASYLVDKFFFGLNPRGYHAINIFLHLVCAVLLFLALLGLECSVFASLAAASLFAIHPINSEAVNFISARNNILTTMFMLAALLAWLRAEKKGNNVLFFVSGFLFFLAMLAKETGIMLLPFLLFLKLYDDRHYRNPRTMLRKDFSFIAFHVIFFVGYLVLHSLAIDDMFIHQHLAGLSGRMHHLIYILPAYFSLLIAPWRVSFYYHIPDDLGTYVFSLAAGWAVLATVLLVLIWKRDRTIIIGLVWVILNFFPISTIVPIPSASMADRYLYLPSIGIAMIVGHSLYRASRNARTGNTVVAASVVIGLLLVFQTIKRSRDWSDDLILNQSIVAKDPSYAVGHVDYGYEAYQHGDRQTAATEFRTALSMDPRLPQASWIYYYLAAMSADDGNFDTAIRYLKDAARYDPFNSKAHFALATLTANSDRNVSFAEYREFLNTMNVLSLSSVHHVPEVNSILPEMQTRPARKPKLPPSSVRIDNDDSWALYHHFQSGTDLYYDKRLEKRNAILTVRTRMHLGQKDKKSYASRFIRYPLHTAADGFFSYDIICAQHLYKLTIMEFRDSNNNVLSTTFPEKEAQEFYEYALPGTVMRSLTESVCTSHDPNN